MQNNNERPLAHVTYICSTKDCGNEQKFYELYFVSALRTHSKYCSKCRALTAHKKILPSDDEMMQYRRPEGNLPSVTYG